LRGLLLWLTDDILSELTLACELSFSFFEKDGGLLFFLVPSYLLEISDVAFFGFVSCLTRVLFPAFSSLFEKRRGPF